MISDWTRGLVKLLLFLLTGIALVRKLHSRTVLIDVLPIASWCGSYHLHARTLDQGSGTDAFCRKVRCKISYLHRCSSGPQPRQIQPPPKRHHKHREPWSRTRSPTIDITSFFALIVLTAITVLFHKGRSRRSIPNIDATSRPHP